MISFRLTDQEFHELRDLCSHHGVRSISELARMALNNVSAPEQPFSATASLEERIGRQAQRIEALERAVRELTQELHASSVGAG